VQKKLVKYHTINEQIEENEARLSAMRTDLAKSTKKISNLKEEIELNEVSVRTSA
jgi:uncharacterized protein YhaN